MFVLGVDPGLTRCGFGAVERRPEGPIAVAAGVLESDPALPVDKRLGQLSTDVDDLFDDLEPEVVALERIFFQQNARSVVSVAQASGIVLAAAARHGIATVQYSPNEVKLAVVGNGAASKAQVSSMVASILGLEAPPSPPDAADALAIGLCHLTRGRLEAAIGSAP